MRNLIVLIISSGLISIVVFKSVTTKPSPRELVEMMMKERVEDQNEVEVEKVLIPYTELIRAIIHVESRGDDLAVNESSNAVGCMQIRPIMVREVNRILLKIGEVRQFTLINRYDRVKSVQMFTIWRQYHHRSDSDEIIARCWNGGGNGAEMATTVKYWEKVQRTLNSYSEKH